MPRVYRRQMAFIQGRAKLRAEGCAVDNEFTAQERRAYGQLCREQRAAAGLTDGLRLSQSDFNAYLERRRAEDKARRGW